MKGSPASQIEGILGTPEFMNIWEQVNDHYLSWDELLGMPMPQGYDPAEVWGIVSTLNRKISMVVPYPSYLRGGVGKQVWIARNRKFETIRGDLSERLGEHSFLWHELCENSSPYFRVGLVLDEMLSVLWRDGIDVDMQRARSLWLGRAKPDNLGERVLLRLIELFNDSGAYAKRRLSQGLVETLNEDLCIPLGKH